VRIDQPEDGDKRPDAAETLAARGADAAWGTGSAPDVQPVRGAAAERDATAEGGAAERDAAGEWDGASQGRPSQGDDASAARAARSLEYRADVEAHDRAYAIDQGYARVREIEEKTLTPAMRRIEAEDPDRSLAGLENRLKGKDRLTEKVTNHMLSNAELSADQAFAKVKDAIRYTFTYSEDHYAEGVRADLVRMGAQFELVDLRNSWLGKEYKGINSRWRVPENNQLFEVQFHTQASFEAKQLTHVAYEKIRDPATSKGEREKLQDFQRQVSADIPIPTDVNDIPDYP